MNDTEWRTSDARKHKLKAQIKYYSENYPNDKAVTAMVKRFEKRLKEMAEV